VSAPSSESDPKNAKVAGVQTKPKNEQNMNFDPAPTSRILIVDDHWIAAAGLAALLKATFSNFVFETSDTLKSALLRIESESEQPALVVVDFWLSDGTALPLLEALRAKGGQTKTLVLSGDTNPELARKVLNHGAWAFCAKTAPAADLVSLIGRALEGAPPPVEPSASPGQA
jgi:DNA-binding NarL/FixJ family response regulator